MSVYPRGKKGIYVYDFQLEGHKFFGSTECTTKREALAFEATIRRCEQQRLATVKKSRSAPLTFEAALSKFLDEVVAFYSGSYRKTVLTAVDWLHKDSGIGASTLLRDIGPEKINEAIARRRGTGVKNATVNRTVTELLRRLFIRARDKWEQDVRRIEWKKFMMSEPKERVRSLGSHEEPALMETMRDDYLPAVRFKLKSGFRLIEVVNLRKSDIDWGRRTIAVTGKGNKKDTIPLSTELRDILWPLQNHPSEFVFTYVAASTRIIQNTGGRSVVRGERYQITYEGMKTAWRRHGPRKAGIEDFRMHDLRHTAATRLGRRANIKVVQKLLRHEDIATTAKYMHAFDDDVRDAMEAETASRQEVPQIVPQVDRKTS